MTTLHQILSSRSSSDASTHGRRRCVESFIGRIWPLSGDPNQATVSEHGDPTDNSPARRHRQRTLAPPLAAPARLRRAYITPLLRTAEVTASDLRISSPQISVSSVASASASSAAPPAPPPLHRCISPPFPLTEAQTDNSLARSSLSTNLRSPQL
ncbi:hypothetical protein U1Q18_026713 [Sarracenia purpurea var. burkii]